MENKKLNIILNGFFAESKALPDMRYTLHVNVAGGEVMKSIAVVSYQHQEDYVNSIFDAILIDAVFSAFDYSAVMMAGHEDMTATLEVQPYDGGRAIKTQYRAILLNNTDQRMEGNTDVMNSIGKVDAETFATVSMQLICPASYDIRMRQVGGIFKQSAAADVLKFILSQNMLHNSYSMDEAVNSITFDKNTYPKEYSTIVIPDGTKLISVGDYLQDKYGVFSTGFGIYFKQRNWYVYSPYNVEKFKEPVDKLVILNAPPNKYTGVRENLKIEGNTITIAATGDTSMKNLADIDALTVGTGTRFADATTLMDYSTPDPADLKPKLEPSNYMTEYTGVDYKNPYNNTQMVPDRFSSNPAKQSSNLAASAGIIIHTVWQNGSMDVLTPGMPVEFMYGKDNLVEKLRGTLLKAELNSQIPMNGFLEPRHVNTIVLSIFLKSSK